MECRLDPDEVEELTLIFLDATAKMWQAICSIEDEEVEDTYIRGQLYSALYEMTDFLIRLAGRPAPQTLEHRIFRVLDIYGKSAVPFGLRKLASRDVIIYRDELGNMAQIMDCWANQQSNRYSYAIDRRTVDHAAISCVG